MTTTEYIFQVLCLLTLIAIPIALSKRNIRRTTRLLLALCPICGGLIQALVNHDRSGVFVALIGLWALFFVMANRKKEEDD